MAIKRRTKYDDLVLSLYAHVPEDTADVVMENVGSARARRRWADVTCKACLRKRPKRK